MGAKRLLFPMVLVLAVAGCGKKRIPGARGTPSQAVQQLFELRQKRKYTAAAGIIDFRELARRCSGDLWGIGEPRDRDTLTRAFQTSWLRSADTERDSYDGATLHFEDVRVGATGGRAITRVSIQGGRGGVAALAAIEYTMQRHMGRWRVVGQVYVQQNGGTLDEENLCAPMLRLARERAERMRVDLTLSHLAQVFLDRLQSGALPNR